MQNLADSVLIFIRFPCNWIHMKLVRSFQNFGEVFQISMIGKIGNNPGFTVCNDQTN